MGRKKKSSKKGSINAQGRQAVPTFVEEKVIDDADGLKATDTKNLSKKIEEKTERKTEKVEKKFNDSIQPQPGIRGSEYMYRQA